MFKKIALLSLAILVLQHFIWLLYMMGFHKTIYNHSPGPCRLVPGVDDGSEDMETLPNGITFISSGLLMPTASSNARKHHSDRKVQGKIFLFDFKDPENGVRELKITGNFDKSSFAPHGISIYQNPKSGRTYIFVVNHPPEEDKIEKFEYLEKDQSLLYVRSYKDKVMRLVNDVAATGEDSFYFTNYNYYRGGLGYIYEAQILPSYGSVVYFDGQHCSTVATRLALPNGVMLSKDGKNLYVATSLYGILYIYGRESNNNLTLLQEFPLHSHLDNILIEPETKNLLIGSHPVMHMIVKHMDLPTLPAPSQVLMVNLRDGGHADSITELYLDDGHTLFGSTVAAIYDHKMLVGTIAHKLLFCEVRTM